MGGLLSEGGRVCLQSFAGPPPAPRQNEITNFNQSAFKEFFNPYGFVAVGSPENKHQKCHHSQYRHQQFLLEIVV